MNGYLTNDLAVGATVEPVFAEFSAAVGSRPSDAEGLFKLSEVAATAVCPALDV
jgi:hypothetical protein